MAVSLGFARRHRAPPRQPLLDVPDLGQTFFRDGERLDENGDVAQSRGHEVHKFFIVDDKLRHEAVLLFNPPFGEIAGEAKVLAACAAGHAIIVGAGTAHHWHHQVADFDPGNIGADLDDFAKRFMTDHEIRHAGRRRAIFEGADFPVGAADTRFDHAQLDVGGR